MLLLTLLTLFACSSNLQGEWNGTCVFEDQNNTEEMSVIAQIQSDNGYSIEGNLWLADWNQNEFEGDITGDHNGKYLLLRSNITTNNGPYQFRIDAQKVGQSLEGDCLIQTPESVGSLIGEIYLSK